MIELEEYYENIYLLMEYCEEGDLSYHIEL